MPTPHGAVGYCQGKSWSQKLSSFDDADFGEMDCDYDHVIDLGEERAARSGRFPAVEEILDRLTASTSQMAKMAQNG